MLKRLVPWTAPVVAAALLLPAPAQAQFSARYKFLEAVRKKDGTHVTDALDMPGSTLVNARDGDSGQTALHIVTARRDLTWMGFLISKGANVNIRDNKGLTPLVLASNMGFVEGVELLVGKKAMVDEASATGETPLIAAVHRRDLAMVRILLKAGADPARADNSGRTALDYARLEGGAVLSEVEAGAKAIAARKTAPGYGPKL